MRFQSLVKKTDGRAQMLLPWVFANPYSKVTFFLVVCNPNSRMSLVRPKLVLQSLFVLAYGSILAIGSAWQGPTYDEIAQLAAGISHWQFGDFQLYRVNPPLARSVAAIPVVLIGAKQDWAAYPRHTLERNDFVVARDFTMVNGSDTFWYVKVARWACIPFALLGAFVCWHWATELHGRRGGLMAAWMWCICPNILGHGQLLTPDVAATSIGAASAYSFWRWLRSPTWLNATIVGMLFGIAVLAKTTLLILFPAWVGIWAMWNVSEHRGMRLIKASGSAFQLFAMLVLASYLINLGYGFEGTLKSLGEYTFVSSTLAGTGDGQMGGVPGNRFADTELSCLPVPFPENFVLGIDQQKREFEKPDWSYLRGEWRPDGWYYYYIYGMLVKIPLGTLLVVASAFLSAGLSCRSPNAVFSAAQTTNHRACQVAKWRDEVVPLILAGSILAFVSGQTGFNRHLRYVLPAFPYIFVWAGRVGPIADVDWLLKLPKAIRGAWSSAMGPTHGVVWLESGEVKPNSPATWYRRVLAVGIMIALIWSTLASAATYPHGLSYFNEVAGGSRNGHWHLVGSNVDWGQSIFFVKAWYDKHPEARPFHAMLGTPIDDLNLVGINALPVPTGPTMNRNGSPTTRNWPWGDLNSAKQDDPAEPKGLSVHQYAAGPIPGWFAISLDELHERGGRYEYLTEFDALETVGSSVNIYHILLEDANELRCRLGLPELAE